MTCISNIGYGVMTELPLKKVADMKRLEPALKHEAKLVKRSCSTATNPSSRFIPDVESRLDQRQ
jgi:hypothetical protein